MFDRLAERLEEYYDYITDTNEAISNGISSLKNLFGDVVNRYKK